MNDANLVKKEMDKFQEKFKELKTDINKTTIRCWRNGFWTGVITTWLGIFVGWMISVLL